VYPSATVRLPSARSFDSSHLISYLTSPTSSYVASPVASRCVSEAAKFRDELESLMASTGVDIHM
jgi:hypothetical protein